MISLIDPRPIEPNWVSDTEQVDMIEYIIVEYFWNKETKKHDKKTTAYNSDTADFLEIIAEFLRSNRQCFAEINASQCVPTSALSNPLHYAIKLPTFTGMSWELKWFEEEIEAEVAYDSEDGTDNDELLAGIEWLCNECRIFSIDISEYDPTP